MLSTLFLPPFCVLLFGRIKISPHSKPNFLAWDQKWGGYGYYCSSNEKVNEMKKRIVSVVLCALLMLCVFPAEALAAQNTEDIVILYENDVHCAVEGYSVLSAMKKELQESYAHVGVVSGGDYIQGTSLGVASLGQYSVDLMNLVGYDAVTLGNHEFDYHLDRLNELVGMMSTKPISCNFGKIGEAESYFEPYTIVSYGDVDIAYIGITTPSTITTSSPAQFKDSNGEYLYTFRPTDLYEVVQKNIDAAKADGAEYIIALSHIGYADDAVYGSIEDVETLIENTEGFDVVLDAHSHSVIEGVTLTDKSGDAVLLSSTGTKFENIGKLTISGGTFKTELIKTAEYGKTDPVVDAYLKQIYTEYAKLGERKVGVSEVKLITKDANGKRLVRNTETNLGDLCAEALRSAVGADIGYINGGGLRADVLAGDITFNDLLSVLPFNNKVVMAEVSGQTIKDMMEMAMMLWPEENGSFPHLSGITFAVNTDIPSSVVLDELEEFVCVDGPYRVYNIKIRNRDTGEYEPIDLKGTYTIASHNYALVEHGSGMKMLENAVVVHNEGMLDVEALERYITEELKGVVGAAYKDAQPNITFTGANECPNSDSCPLCLYTDLDKTQWYHDGVHYCIDEGLMQGGADGLFAPKGITTRAELITILWRMEGSPVVPVAEDFVDSLDGSGYYNAIRWASANRIAEGYGDSIWGPNDAITREQLATVLWRYSKYKGYDVSVGEETNILSYKDAFDVAEYAIPAMQWACGSDIIRGVEQNDTIYLAPQGDAVRSQSATIIYRFFAALAQ